MRCSHAVLLALVLVAVYVTTEARYLPTRSQDDRLDRLRELLRDVSYVRCVLPVTGLNPGFDVQKFQLNDQWSESTSVFVKFGGSGGKLRADFKNKYRSRCSLKPKFSNLSSLIIIIIIIIIINCNWVVTRWHWLFYMYTKYEIGY